MKKEFLTKLFIALSLFCVFSCSDDDDKDVIGGDEISGTESSSKYEAMLKNTSWKQTYGYRLNDDGTKRNEDIHSGVLTFADNNVLYIIGLKVGSSLYTASGTWKGTEMGVDITMKGDSENSWASYQGMVTAAGFYPGYIIDLSNSTMKCKTSESSDYYYEFTKVSYQEPGNNGGSGGSGGSGDKPYVTSFDFTATKTSITVKFMCSERPTSATVRYGNSSPSSTVSSSISGKQVTATVSGLKSGTKYYFNCTVQNSYGSSTSDTYPAITNY